MHSHCCSLPRKTKLQGERKRTQPAPGWYSHHQVLHLWSSTMTSSLPSAYVQLLGGLINTVIQVPAVDRRHTTLPHLTTRGHSISARIAQYVSSGYRAESRQETQKKKCFEDLQPGALHWKDVCVQRAGSFDTFLFILLINTKWGLLRKNQQHRGRGA